MCHVRGRGGIRRRVIWGRVIRGCWGCAEDGRVCRSSWSGSIINVGYYRMQVCPQAVQYGDIGHSMTQF